MANGIRDVRRKTPSLPRERERGQVFRLEASLSSLSRHHEQGSPSRVEKVSMCEGHARLAASLYASSSVGAVDPPQFPRAWHAYSGQRPRRSQAGSRACVPEARAEIAFLLGRHGYQRHPRRLCSADLFWLELSALRLPLVT